ncbi:MAG: hypothetical protein K8R48_04630 [Alphaproteobacteria bacterium]|nr:hypothetical protein [Alphaproteobacteria bacterium]
MARDLIIFLLLTAFSFPAYAAKFDLNTYSIAWWKNSEVGISIRLTEEAKRGFSEITQNNLNKKIELYVGELLVSSPTVHEPLSSDGRIFLVVDKQLHQQIIPLLPQEKKDTGKIFFARNQHEVDSLIKSFLLSQSNTDPALAESAESQGNAVADLNNDGKPEIILVWTTLGKTYWRNTLTVFATMGHGYTLINSLPLKGEAKLSSVKDGIIFVDQTMPAKDDPVCCPTLKRQMKYQWIEYKVSELK